MVSEERIQPIAPRDDRLIVDRAVLALARQGVSGGEAIRSLSDDELLRYRGVGPRALGALRDRYGPALGDAPLESPPATFGDAIGRALDTLPDRERLVLERLYGLDGQPAEPASAVGVRLERSASRIRALRDQALRRLTYPTAWSVLRPWLQRFAAVAVIPAGHQTSIELQRRLGVLFGEPPPIGTIAFLTELWGHAPYDGGLAYR